MGAEADSSDVSARCISCGQRIEADDRAELNREYTDHQVEQHDKPRSVSHARR